MGSHVILQLTIGPQDLPADFAGELLPQEHLVLRGQVAVLGGLPSMPGAHVALPLLWRVHKSNSVDWG